MSTALQIFHPEIFAQQLQLEQPTRRSTWLSPAHRYRVHPAWPQEGGPGPNLPLRGPLKSIRGAVPKQQPRERERRSSYSDRRDNIDDAMPTVRTMTCTHITWVMMVHMKDGQSHTHRLQGLRVVRTDTCPGRVECARRRTKCELCAKCAGQGDRRMLCVTGLPGAAPHASFGAWSRGAVQPLWRPATGRVLRLWRTERYRLKGIFMLY